MGVALLLEVDAGFSQGVLHLIKTGGGCLQQLLAGLLLGHQVFGAGDRKQFKLTAQLVITNGVGLAAGDFSLALGDIAGNARQPVAATFRQAQAQITLARALARLHFFELLHLGGVTRQVFCQRLQPRLDQAQFDPGKVRFQGLAAGAQAIG